MRTTITFGRGRITRHERTVNKQFDPTEIVTITLELNTGMVLTQTTMWDAEVWGIDGDKVSRDTFFGVLKAAGHDWDALCKAVYKKEAQVSAQWANDPIKGWY